MYHISIHRKFDDHRIDYKATSDEVELENCSIMHTWSHVAS